VRGRLTARFGPNPKIVVRSLDELAQLPDQSTDLAVMISVAQYMTAAELEGAFALMRRILKPGGRLVLGDILRPEVGAATDVMALLKLAVKNGFLTDALWASPAQPCRTTGNCAKASACSVTARRTCWRG
jgi:ubiquinone/menaquinone biosynthesis C-methylase UbiE